MRAAVVPALGAPLEIRELPVPEPGPGQVLVRIEASGLCHTDIHAARGDWPVTPTPPFVPGHEGVGRVERLGPGATGPSEGDRVALPWLGTACGRCRYCVSGWETLCPQQQNTGYSIDGGYAEYAVADARYAVPVPDGIDPADAAPLTCAGVTTYKAVKVSGARPAVLVSLPKDGILTVPIFDTVLKGISVIGSIVGTRQDLADVFALHAAGRTHVAAETRRLDQVNDAFTEVLNGRVPARLVFRF